MALPGARRCPETVLKTGGQPDAIFAWPPSWPTHLGPSSRRAGGTDGSAAEPPPLNARMTSRRASTSSTTARALCRPLVATPDRELGSSACPAFGPPAHCTDRTARRGVHLGPAARESTPPATCSRSDSTVSRAALGPPPCRGPQLF